MQYYLLLNKFFSSKIHSGQMFVITQFYSEASRHSFPTNYNETVVHYISVW